MSGEGQRDGVLFVATGSKYIDAGIRAAHTVREHCPDLPVHLFADWRAQGYDFEHDLGPFTSIGDIEQPHRRSKVDYMQHTPFERTLYLDTDTAVRTDITEMFQLLDRFDIALAHEHIRSKPVRTQMWRTSLPMSFPQFNSGVFMYRRSPSVISFIDEWRDAYKSAGLKHDQITLRELLWLSDLRIATLPPEYNVRYLKYHVIRSKHEARSKIFHLRAYHERPLDTVRRTPARLRRRYL